MAPAERWPAAGVVMRQGPPGPDEQEGGRAEVGLRYRLWVVLGAAVVVPLLLAGALLVVVVSRASEERAGSALESSARSVSSSLAQKCSELEALSAWLGAEAALAADAEAVGAAAAAVVRDGRAAYAGVFSGPAPVGEAGDRPAAVGTLASCEGELSAPVLAGTTTGVVLRPGVPSRPGAVRVTVAVSVQGAWLQHALRDLESGAVVALVAGGEVLASSRDGLDPGVRDFALAVAADTADDDGVRRGSGRLGYAQQLEPESAIVTVVVDDAPARLPLAGLTLLVVLLLCAVTVGLARLLVGRIIDPLVALAEATERVVAGDLETRVPAQAQGDDEVGRVGRSVTRMTVEMRHYLQALERSRDELRDNLERLGEALSATHDLDSLVQVVLESAVAAVDARAGVAYIAESNGPLTLVAAQGFEDLDIAVARRVVPGRGLLGKVASSGLAVRGRMAAGPGELEPGELQPGDEDPTGCDLLAVPLRGGNRVSGVLVLLDRTDGTPFTAEHEDEIRALAGQAGIAVDNVLLHRETERLAITDPLTGLWNFRYLSMSLAREIERASRFERSLAVLMLDIDHFKAINDTYGHATGDEVLREFSVRVLQETREVDILARYGGEEFVLALPETTTEGARQLGERIRTSVADLPFPGPEGSGGIPVTVSIGIAAFPEHGASPATLLRSADSALYAAKRGGRNRVQLAEPPPGPGPGPVVGAVPGAGPGAAAGSVPGVGLSGGEGEDGGGRVAGWEPS